MPVSVCLYRMQASNAYAEANHVGLLDGNRRPFMTLIIGRKYHLLGLERRTNPYNSVLARLRDSVTLEEFSAYLPGRNERLSDATVQAIHADCLGYSKPSLTVTEHVGEQPNRTARYMINPPE